jgi:hypothetical protein
LTTLEIPPWLNKISFVVILFVSFALMNYRTHYLKKYGTMAKEFVKISEYLDENSIILPVRSSDYWLDLHFSNYLGISKTLIILENYEACTGYFPLEWNTVNMPMIVLADTVRKDLCLYNKFPGHMPDSLFIDYVIKWGEKPLEGCKEWVSTLVSQTYDTVYYSQINDITLFKRAGRFK